MKILDTIKPVKKYTLLDSIIKLGVLSPFEADSDIRAVGYLHKAGLSVEDWLVQQSEYLDEDDRGCVLDAILQLAPPDAIAADAAASCARPFESVPRHPPPTLAAGDPGTVTETGK